MRPEKWRGSGMGVASQCHGSSLEECAVGFVESETTASDSEGAGKYSSRAIVKSCNLLSIVDASSVTSWAAVASRKFVSNASRIK